MPTKMPQRPVKTFVDGLISSIAALHLTIISFVAIYSYVGFERYQQNRTETKLVALDKLLALRHLARGNLNIDDAKLFDLARFFTGAESEYFEQQKEELLYEDQTDKDGTSPSPPSKFTDEPLQGSHIVHDVTMRMSPSGRCDVLITKLAPGRVFSFVTFLVVGAVFNVKSEDAQLITFYRCEGGPRPEFNALLFKLKHNQFAFALPHSLEQQFLGFRPPAGFSNFVLEEIDEVAKLLPDQMQKYLHFSEEFVFLHAKAIDSFILHYTNTELRKHFPPDRMDDATRQLYEQNERQGSYFGISAPGIFFIRIGPLIFFALSFELWRRVRRLPPGKFESEKYWFAFETRDVVGRAYAYLYALAPLAFGVLVYVLFAVSQGLVLIVFGRLITIPGLLALDFPKAPGSGWISEDHFAQVLGVLAGAQFLILLLTVRKLAKVVAANLRPSSVP